MRKTKCSILSLMTALLCGIFILASCAGTGGTHGGEPTTPIKLTAPTVTLIGDVASWSANPDVDRFEISVDGTLSYIESSVTSKTLADGQSFKVRAIGDGTNYTNSDWSNSVTYRKPTAAYTVTWKNGDTVLETDEGVAYGAMPSYDGSEPTKAATAQYTYRFAGWSPAVTSVTGDVTYYAQFTSAVNRYTVVWKNGDTVLETDEGAAYGAMPSYDGSEPTKAATAQYTYRFAGWSPAVTSVTGDVTYLAQFDEQTRLYTVTFRSEDGSVVLASVTVPYGSAAVYPNAQPTKNGTADLSYLFGGWTTKAGGSQTADLSRVEGDKTVYASFTEVTRRVTVYVVPSNADYGKTSVAVFENIPYGAQITLDGNTVSVNGQTATAQPSDRTERYSYTFTGWSADTTVGSDTVITALFSRSLNTYTVTWKNGDTVLKTDESVPYGTTPIYNGETPVKAADGEGAYLFGGWSPAVTSVTGDVTYVAQFTDAAGKHTVIFFDEDGVTELGRAVVGDGEAAVYPNALPTKAATEQIAYTLEKWVTAKNGTAEASLANITKDTSVYAKYSEAARTYTVTFCDWDGTVLTSAAVAYGADATPPETPEREGYRFVAWSGSYDRITEDRLLTATYRAEVTIRFLDYDESVIYEETFDRGGSLSAVPNDPERRDYVFDGWSVTDYSELQEDLTVYARYTRLWRVSFFDHDGTLLQRQSVKNGTAATSPSDPTREGYRFIGWDTSYDVVTSDLKVTARYEIRRYTVTFIGPDGKTISIVQNVRHGFSTTAPTVDELYFDWNVKKGYRFTGWSASCSAVKEDLTIRALYEEEITEPIRVVRSAQAPQGTTDEIQVTVYVCMQERLYGISMDVTADPVFLLGEEKTSVKAGSAFALKDGEVASISGMKNELKCEFRWADTNIAGSGVDPSAYGGPIPVLTLGLYFNEFQAAGSYEITISEDTYLINENLEKVKPIIISGTVTLGN